jgi:pterin-4a-carbinolamine dehydratase
MIRRVRSALSISINPANVVSLQAVGKALEGAGLCPAGRLLGGFQFQRTFSDLIDLEIGKMNQEEKSGLESWNFIDQGIRKRFFRGSYRAAVSFMNKIGRSHKEGVPPDLVIDKDGLWVIFHLEENRISPQQKELALKIDRAYQEIVHEEDPPLGKSEIESLKKGLPGWQFSGRSLQREIKVDSFKTAVEFANRVAAVGIGSGHLPDLVISKESVLAIVSGRFSSGITVSDINLARQISEVIEKFDEGQGLRNR